MKKLVLLLVLLLLPSVSALPYSDHIIELSVNMSYKLIPTSNYAELKDITSEVYAFPKNSKDQKVLELKTNPLAKTDHDKLVYEWRNVENTSYEYRSVIERTVNPIKVTSKELYPFDITILLPEVLQLTKPSTHVDSDYPKIKEIAQNLAKDETDLWNLAVKTAIWVKRHVPYDLNTLTANAAQKASWVLENKKGVCDEITALFMALLRANNIPARFVYGVSYTENPAVSQQWGPHGWAEVYFPNYGWVPFDVTFDQYGWIDTGHVKLHEGNDPELKSLQLTWRGKDYNVSLGNIEYAARIKQSKEEYSSNVEMNPTAYLDKVGFESFNLIIANIINDNNYYVATNIILGQVKENEIIGEDEQFVNLAPGEEKQIYFTTKLKPGLDEKSDYKIPVVLLNEKNEKSETSFTVSKGNTKLSQADINAAKAILEEEKIKPLSNSIDLNCTAPAQVGEYETAELVCNVTSDGSSYFENAGVCLFQKCKEITLRDHAKVSFPLALQIGRNDLRVTFRHEKASKSQTITVEKLDTPEVQIENLIYPKQTHDGENLKLNFTITQKSYTSPKNLSAKIYLPKQTQLLKIEDFKKNLPLEIEIKSKELYGGDNKIIIAVETGEGAEKRITKEEIKIKKEGKGAVSEIIYGVGEFFRSILDAFLSVFGFD
ncbi:transglutaminase domain-containing protein [Candidatus Woesearchaeota archaeon]|nr:transglutaminase domain-containing protein [Candidatus Woesearchaeota archaeon]